MSVNKFDIPMMISAKAFAELSVSKRKKVGAVLSKNNRILAVGYNGTLSGLDNECEIECDECGGNGCDKCGGEGVVTSEFVLHAEQNLISHCAKNGIATDGAVLYLTMSPCKNCAKLIAACGISSVIYDEIYRDSDGIDYLEKCDIEIKKV